MRVRLRPERWLAVVVGAITGALAAFNVKVAFGLVLAGAVALLLLLGAEFLLLGVVAVEPWTDALQPLAIPKIVGFLAVAAWVLAAAMGRTKLRFTPQMGWALAFMLFVVLSLMLAPDPGESVSTTISYALYILFLGLFVQSIRSNADAERCLAVYAGSIALGTFYGLATFVGGGNHLAGGPIGDPNDYASSLAGGLPLAAYFAVHSARARALWQIGCVLIVAALLATLSRGALVGFAAVVVLALLSGRISLNGVLAGVLAILIAVGVGFAFFKPLINQHVAGKTAYAQVNVTSREAFWAAAVKMAENHPLFGVGPGRFPIEAPDYIVNNPVMLSNPVTHESYLEILAEDGIFGILLYLAFLASSWRALLLARRLAREAGDRRGVDLAEALMAGFLWTVVTMLFITRALAIPLWLFSGVAGSLVLARRAQLLALPAAPPPAAGDPYVGTPQTAASPYAAR